MRRLSMRHAENNPHQNMSVPFSTFVWYSMLNPKITKLSSDDSMFVFLIRNFDPRSCLKASLTKPVCTYDPVARDAVMKAFECF